MLQVAVSGGEVRVVEVPEPSLRPGGILVRTSHSLISAGTESAGLGGGGRRETLVMKAIRNPQLVKKVFDRVASHGFSSTVELVRNRVTSELATGYSIAGTVIDVASDVTQFRRGDRVACCGAGYANHAAVNWVPQNLAVLLPDNVSFEEGCFGTLGAIALQGIRRAAPTLGDRVLVLGLGLIGQITVQLLRAAGAEVMGCDVRADRVARARGERIDAFSLADTDVAREVLARTNGAGADAVIVTAAAADPALLNSCFDACRKKGRVVLVGDVPIRIQRDKIYRKEIDFLISSSYGPGRYDPSYEERGIDYPFAFVRWTEGRNLGEIVRLIGNGSLDVRPLIDRLFPIERATEAYLALAGEERPIGVLLEYPHSDDRRADRHSYRRAGAAPRPSQKKSFGVGVIGYGGYFRSMLLPLLRSHDGFALQSVCSRNGLSVRSAVDKDGFATGSTDSAELIADPSVDVVYIATRHDLHYPLARAAIEAGKSVFVEKPMATTAADARALADLVQERGAFLTVGFNRRFSPHAQLVRRQVASIATPKNMLYGVNAGALPADHWLFDLTEGGGRLVGEGVHFFDFLAFLSGSRPVRVAAASPRGRSRDEAAVVMEFENGDVGTVVYTGEGSPAAGKERVEVFAGGATFVIDDFRTTAIFGRSAKGLSTKTIEKGQKEHLDHVYLALRGEVPLAVSAEDGYLATWCAERAVSSALHLHE